MHKYITFASSFMKPYYFSDTKHLKLLIAMREHIDQDSTRDNLTDGIISFVWNLSDRTILVPLLLDAGYAHSVLKWIRNREIKFRDDKLDAPIHILHNLSRHDDGIQQLNNSNFILISCINFVKKIQLNYYIHVNNG